MPENVIVKNTKLNQEFIVNEKSTIKEALEERLKGVTTVRKNAVVAIEFVMGASADFYQGDYSAQAYLTKCKEFIAARYGKENIISWHMHFDEANPHIHVLITPIVEKRIEWKNRWGSGVRKERRLCARDITGGPSKLRAMHDAFYEHIVPIGIKACVKFVPRTPAENQTKEYSRRTNHHMAKINQLAERARLEVDAAARLELQKQILKEKAELDKALQLKNEAERKAALNKEINKKLNRNNDQGREL